MATLIGAALATLMLGRDGTASGCARPPAPGRPALGRPALGRPAPAG